MCDVYVTPYLNEAQMSRPTGRYSAFSPLSASAGGRAAPVAGAYSIAARRILKHVASDLERPRRQVLADRAGRGRYSGV
jgi:hypothetical protein